MPVPVPCASCWAAWSIEPENSPELSECEQRGLAFKVARLDLQDVGLVDQFSVGDRDQNLHQSLRRAPLSRPPKRPPTRPVDSREQRISRPRITRLDISEFPP